MSDTPLTSMFLPKAGRGAVGVLASAWAWESRTPGGTGSAMLKLSKLDVDLDFLCKVGLVTVI